MEALLQQSWLLLLGLKAVLLGLSRNPRTRRNAARVAYVLFVFAFVEISLQLFYRVTAGDFLFRRDTPALYQSEAYAGYGNRRGLSYIHHTNEFAARYNINQQGFRVPDRDLSYAVPKPPGTYRILLLGPSFAYGWGVDYDKSFAALLPQMLAKQGFAAGQKIELINAGVPSLQPGPQLNWFEHEGRKYQPDLVIQFVYASMAEPSDPPSNYAADAEGHLIDRNMSTGQRWRERAKQFATVFYGWMLWTEMDALLSPGPPDRAVQGAGRQFVQESGFDIGKPHVRTATAFYLRLRNAVHASGAQLRIVYFPLSYVIYPADESRWRHLGVQNVAAQQAFDRAFVKYLGDQDIPTLDISPDLHRATAQEKRLYYWLDIHWTPEGNAAAARAVASALARRGCPPNARQIDGHQRPQN